jgi:lysophospholipase L1-like esterase
MSALGALPASTEPPRDALPPTPAERPRPSRGRRAVFFALPYVAFLFLLGGIEVAVRAGLPPVSTLELFVPAKEQQAQFVDRQQVRIFDGDPLLAWRLQPGLRDVAWDLTLVTTNAQGIRYGHAVGPKRPGLFRIVCLGDSVTFGYRVPLVFPRRPNDYDPTWRSYPVLMERKLRQLAPDIEIEVIPLAVPGYSSYQGLAWLRRDIAWLRPDVVTACFGWNDIGRRAATDADAFPGDWSQVTARAAVAHSQALSHAVMWLRSRRAPAVPQLGRLQPMRVPREQYVANMLAIARLARRYGAAPVLIGPVYRDPVAHPPEGDEIGAHRDALREAAAAAGIDYLEIPELTEKAYPGNDHLFGEHIHPNHRGHRLLAESLLRFLVERGLLPSAARRELEASSDTR